MCIYCYLCFFWLGQRGTGRVSQPRWRSRPYSRWATGSRNLLFHHKFPAPAEWIAVESILLQRAWILNNLCVLLNAWCWYIVGTCMDRLQSTWKLFNFKWTTHSIIHQKNSRNNETKLVSPCICAALSSWSSTSWKQSFEAFLKQYNKVMGSEIYLPVCSMRF